MKAKESIDDTRKSMDLSPTDSDAAVRSSTSIPENKRRRLVRGAMAVAPLLLTLRSGALAASSCTGVKLTGVSVKSSNAIPPATDPRAGELLNPTKPLVAGDVCVQPGVLQNCAGPQAGKVLTSSPINGGNTLLIVPRDGGTGTDFWTCGDRQFQGDSVAILSNASVTSMGVG